VVIVALRVSEDCVCNKATRRIRLQNAQKDFSSQTSLNISLLSGQWGKAMSGSWREMGDKTHTSQRLMHRAAVQPWLHH